MKIAVTGATGFLGRYIVQRLLADGNQCRCWYRKRESCYQPPDLPHIEWVEGQLGNAADCERLVDGCDAVVHSGLHRTGTAFRGGEGDIVEFAENNIVGSLQLIEAARNGTANRFVFISTCAVHEQILEDRPLDEHHPLMAKSHYGAGKAAVEQFVHSFGFGMGFNICALRPSGIYGVHHRVEESKWFALLRSVRNGEDVTCQRGGKEVHAADVAAAVELLLHSDNTTGEVYSCCDLYVSELDVALLAKKLSTSGSQIHGEPRSPRHTIICDKLKGLGFRFGGRSRLEATVADILKRLEHAG